MLRMLQYNMIKVLLYKGSKYIYDYSRYLCKLNKISSLKNTFLELLSKVETSTL